MASAERLLALLRDAAAEGRPAVTLTDARLVELLGVAPDDGWWDANAAAVAAAGWRAYPLRERGWVRFEPGVPAGSVPAPTTVVVRLDPDELRTGSVTVAGKTRPLDPGDPDDRALAEAAGRVARRR